MLVILTGVSVRGVFFLVLGGRFILAVYIYWPFIYIGRSFVHPREGLLPRFIDILEG